MHVVAGPPGGGKSSVFPVKSAGFDYFDADARAAALNGGSFRGISLAMRRTVNREFEQFIERHIDSRKSFAFETTLRSAITFDQAQSARGAGFSLVMTYVALKSVDLHLDRVAARADIGGHSAPPQRLRQIYASSLTNLRRALVEFDDVAVYDNTGAFPELALRCNNGRVTWLHTNAPAWVLAAKPA